MSFSKFELISLVVKKNKELPSLTLGSWGSLSNSRVELRIIDSLNVGVSVMCVSQTYPEALHTPSFFFSFFFFFFFFLFNPPKQNPPIKF